MNNETHKILPAFEDKNIPIVFATDIKFIPYLGVAIKSLISNSSSDNNYDIVILCNDINELRQEQIRSMKRKNISIRFYNISELLNDYKNNLYLRANYSNAIYYRFFIPQLFVKYNKIIYLDSDLIINCDIAEVYNINLNNAFIGAVKDLPLLRQGDYYNNFITEKIGIDCNKYFNSGVLLFNLEKLDKEKFFNTCINILNILKEPFFPDQDVFNYIFKNSVLYLDNKYNVSWNCIHFWKDSKKTLPPETYNKYVENLKHPKIFHYAGEYKPWKQPELLYSEYFWQYARQTSFYEEIIYLNTKIIPNTRNIIRNAVYRHKIYAQYLKCRILKFLTFGDVKQHYSEKTSKLKKQVRDYRNTLKI